MVDRPPRRAFPWIVPRGRNASRPQSRTTSRAGHGNERRPLFPVITPLSPPQQPVTDGGDEAPHIAIGLSPSERTDSNPVVALIRRLLFVLPSSSISAPSSSRSLAMRSVWPTSGSTSPVRRHQPAPGLILTAPNQIDQPIQVTRDSPRLGARRARFGSISQHLLTRIIYTAYSSIHCSSCVKRAVVLAGVSGGAGCGRARLPRRFSVGLTLDGGHGFMRLVDLPRCGCSVASRTGLG